MVYRKGGTKNSRKTVKIRTDLNKFHREITEYNTKEDRKQNTQTDYERRQAALSREDKPQRPHRKSSQRNKSVIEKENKYIHARRSTLKEIKKLKIPEKQDPDDEIRLQRTHSEYNISVEPKNQTKSKKYTIKEKPKANNSLMDKIIGFFKPLHI